MRGAIPLGSASVSHSLAPRKTEEEEEEEELEETAQEKKLRLAKLYLEQLRQQGELEGLMKARVSARACLLPLLRPQSSDGSVA